MSKPFLVQLLHGKASKISASTPNVLHQQSAVVRRSSLGQESSRRAGDLKRRNTDPKGLIADLHGKRALMTQLIDELEKFAFILVNDYWIGWIASHLTSIYPTLWYKCSHGLYLEEGAQDFE
ncbi:hypothetical protein ABIA25_000749 [Sinorhizobium fredii]|uniref:hypothetical protein n=1 Tax=Rhizobium fredii TaxID=380 RepID=UPI003512D161